VYGDSYLPIDPRDAWSRFCSGGAPALMTVLHNEGRWDTSNADYEAGRVRRYRKGSPTADMHYVDYGLSMLRREVVEERVGAGEHADLASVFEQLSTDGLLAGYEVHERFYEVGSQQGLADLEQHLTGPAER
jgi:MurNAc alpha-1-phosphate uridylyltransferase